MHAPARASEAGLNSVFAALYNSARCGRQEWRLTRKSYSLQLALQVAQSVESRDTRSAKVRCCGSALAARHACYCSCRTTILQTILWTGPVPLALRCSSVIPKPSRSRSPELVGTPNAQHRELKAARIVALTLTLASASRLRNMLLWRSEKEWRCSPCSGT